MRGVAVGVAAFARAPPRCQIGHRARSAPRSVPIGGPVHRQVARGFTIRRPALGGRCERVVSRPASASISRALGLHAKLGVFEHGFRTKAYGHYLGVSNLLVSAVVRV